jgi:hypothetical protein
MYWKFFYISLLLFLESIELYNIFILFIKYAYILRNEITLGYSSEVDTRYWYGNLPVDYLSFHFFFFFLSINFYLDLLLTLGNLISYTADTYWTLLFCIFSFHYFFKTLMFELICFSQYFNDRQNKLNKQLLNLSENELIEKKYSYLITVFLLTILI